MTDEEPRRAGPHVDLTVHHRWTLMLLAFFIGVVPTSAHAYDADILAASIATTATTAVAVPDPAAQITPSHCKAHIYDEPRTARDTRTTAARVSFAAKAAPNVLTTPSVSSPKLQNIVNNLYKGTTNSNRVGNGTTMDAIRNEAATGLQTGSKWHSIKGQESLNGLNNWLRRNPDAPYSDRLVAQSLADELALVLRGAG